MERLRVNQINEVVEELKVLEGQKDLLLKEILEKAALMDELRSKYINKEENEVNEEELDKDKEFWKVRKEYTKLREQFSELGQRIEVVYINHLPDISNFCYYDIGDDNYI